jgi:hypothetical protein
MTPLSSNNARLHLSADGDSELQIPSRMQGAGIPALSMDKCHWRVLLEPYTL